MFAAHRNRPSEDVLAAASRDPGELACLEPRRPVGRRRGCVVEQPVLKRAPQVPPTAPVAAAVQEVGDRLVVVEDAFEVQEHPQRLGVMPRGEAPARGRQPAAALVSATVSSTATVA